MWTKQFFLMECWRIFQFCGTKHMNFEDERTNVIPPQRGETEACTREESETPDESQYWTDIVWNWCRDFWKRSRTWARRKKIAHWRGKKYMANLTLTQRYSKNYFKPCVRSSETNVSGLSQMGMLGIGILTTIGGNSESWSQKCRMRIAAGWPNSLWTADRGGLREVFRFRVASPQYRWPRCVFQTRAIWPKLPFRGPFLYFESKGGQRQVKQAG